MERLLVVWCPDLLEQQEHGREARAFARVLAAVGGFSPHIDVPRPGLCAVPTRGPSRYFGGDSALATLVARALVGIERVDLEPRRIEPSGCGLFDAGNSGLEETGTVTAGVGVGDGLFAATLAARSALERLQPGPCDRGTRGHPRLPCPLAGHGPRPTRAGRPPVSSGDPHPECLRRPPRPPRAGPLRHRRCHLPRGGRRGRGGAAGVAALPPPPPPSSGSRGRVGCS